MCGAPAASQPAKPSACRHRCLITCLPPNFLVSRRSLQCEGCPVQAQGSLPAALADLAAATTLNLQGNAFGGGLPREWGAPGAMQAMQSM